MKHPIDDAIASLEAEYKTQTANTKAPGNPYICAVGGKINGMMAVLDHPLYAAAPELLEALEQLLIELEAHEIYAPVRMALARAAIAKAKGGA